MLDFPVSIRSHFKSTYHIVNVYSAHVQSWEDILRNRESSSEIPLPKEVSYFVKRWDGRMTVMSDSCSRCSTLSFFSLFFSFFFFLDVSR